MKVLKNTLLLLALLGLLSGSTAHAQLRLKQLREALEGTQQSSQTGKENPIQQRIRNQRKQSSQQQTVSTTARDQNGSRALPKVDLTVTDVRGGDDALMATIQNLGFTTSPATDLLITIKDRVTGQVRATRTPGVRPIESGKVVRVRLNSLPLGNSVVHVTVDPFRKVAEGDEGNNFRSATFGTPSLPENPRDRADLYISRLQAQGNILQVYVTNNGRAASNAAPLNIVVRGRDGRLQDTDSARVRPLKIGETEQLHIRNLVLDDVTVITTIDPENRVPELNESNNTRQVSIRNQTQFAPDLIVSDIQFKPQQKEVWFTVRNVGPVAQTQDVSLTVKSFFGPGNQVERTAMRVSRLNSGQSSFHRWSVQQLNSGMQFEGVLDVSNRLPEQNETNNRRVETFN